VVLDHFSMQVGDYQKEAAYFNALMNWKNDAGTMGILLADHLGVVLGLFLSMPYGKFVHALYRFAALTRFHIERRRPLPEIGSE